MQVGIDSFAAAFDENREPLQLYARAIVAR